MVLGKKFEKLTVRDFFLTIKISEDNKYLTPIAILESRALINCIQWIYWTMGNIAACRDAILVYLSEIYQNTIPEYTFVVNLFAQYYGYRDLQHFIENHPLRDLEHLLIMINACCWYALQAPPPMNEYSLHNSNPIARILLCINAVQDCIEREDAFAHIPQFLDSVDRSQSALNLFFQPIRSILDYCLKYLRYLKQKNSELKNNEQIKQHFGRIMDAQINQITKRQESEFPYASFSGLAESGNPMLGIEADEMDALLLDYIPDEKVKIWFNDRDQLLFKVQSRTHTIDLLEKWFHPSAFT